ncbi:hypothetical protein AAC03nite_37670 [Alicyclobacillus acidoterrestris]|uniref:glycosyltransferase n=1 Tax=Alicyclobacillus suci TaxID=2816080 RepID=UPI00118FE0FF|nr:glycosyltransferase [Alicyclobacillus suci]GEO27982.1 hypothetical protein AAC03nite_37670 [Alicyclobacillus acidoterrestris]
MQPCVLFVLDQLNIGGTETHVLSIARELKRRGVKVLVAGKSGALLSQLQASGIAHFDLPFALTDAIDPALRAQLTQQLTRVVVEQGVNILHAHQTPSGSIAASVASHLGIPLMFTIHGTYYEVGPLKAILEQCRICISVSLPVQDYLANFGHASVLIPNGVDIDAFRPMDSAVKNDVRGELGIHPSSFVVLSASRISWQKAAVIRLLLQVCRDVRVSRMPNLHLLVVGEGYQFGDLQRFANKLNARRKGEFIHLLGNRQDMNRCYAAADLVVGTGRVALEAMACGKPVVAVGEHGFFGLVEPANFDLAWSMYFGDHGSRFPASRSRLFREINAAVRRDLTALGAVSRDWVTENFSVAKTCDDLLQQYMVCIG